jgi:ribosomal peptide maturation radical SAM protein 1
VRDERVLLVSMPFGALERPSLALGLLQSHCRRMDVPCTTQYLNMRYAARIGIDEYLWLDRDVPYTAFAGDWIFAQSLHGSRPDADGRYIADVLRGTWQLADPDVERILRARTHVEPFLDECLDTVPWGDYTVVGFTSVFQQNIASLSLAARVKAALPSMTIAFGGANWEEAMGIALLRQFPFVDLAFSGEADQSFPAVLAARAAGESVQGIPGVAVAGVPRRPKAEPATAVAVLDDVPTPDFDAFFEQRAAGPVSGVAPTLLAETARGCWWGERSHCTFCGLNGATMAFRSKSPDRVVDELAYLRDRYAVASFSIVDDILDMRYFKTVVPMLAASDLGVELFWEIKANLTDTQVRQLRDAGVTHVQPGVESLSDHVLGLMRKGTTALRNVELLKWCKEYGVKPMWNFLYGFPGETAADYDEQLETIKSIWHLDAPTGYGPIRLDRFSPFHADPTAFGMTNVRPMAPFLHLYPFDPARVLEIAYYFEFDYADDRRDDTFAREAVDLVRTWMAQPATGALNLELRDDGAVFVEDTRQTTTTSPRTALLRGWKAAVFLACDRTQTFHSLVELPAVRRASVSEEELATFLGRCVEHRLMLRGERSWLNVAVHAPAREHADSGRRERRRPGATAAKRSGQRSRARIAG